MKKMLKVNEYFDGKVKSIGFSTSDGPATLGVMAPGDYEFSTSSEELLTMITGEMQVCLPGETEFRKIRPSETFIVGRNQKFNLKIGADTAYLCLYR
jgi:purine/pyrimidine-nucleoside phosphorylase